MKISEFIKSITERPSQPKSAFNREQLTKDQSDFLLEVSKPDILGQGVGRLIYPAFLMYEAHSEDYETALQTVGAFKQIHDYDERLTFWGAHPKVFGLATIIVFDTYKREYWPFYGLPQTSLSDFLYKTEGQYQVARIFPADNQEFKSFADWCVEKYIRFAPHSIPSETTYWEEIKDNLLPEEYLANLLTKAEFDRNQIYEIPTHWGSENCTDELAEQHFFFYGNQDATRGQGERSSFSKLFTILNKVLTCPQWTYGAIIAQYFYGYRTAVMVAFLREQKKRLDNGENIKIPAGDEVKDSPKVDLIQSQFYPGKSVKSVEEILPSLIKPHKSYGSLMQLAQLSGLSLITPYAPDYSQVFSFFDERYPNRITADNETKIGTGYSDILSEFKRELERQLNDPARDQASRVSYLTRLADRLYTGRTVYGNLNSIGEYMQSKAFTDLKGEIDSELWYELKEIGFAALHSAVCGLGVSGMLERALQIEGVAIKDGLFYKESAEQTRNTGQHPTTPEPIVNTNDETLKVSITTDFINLFDTQSDAYACLAFMKNLNLISSNGKHKIGDRDKAQLMALVEALQHRTLLPPAKTTSELTQSVAKQIGLDYKRPRNGDRKKYDGFLNLYISKLNAISMKKLTWSIVADSGR